MKVVPNQIQLVTLEMSLRDFEIIRKTVKTVLKVCWPEELPSLTGKTKEELIQFSDMLDAIAAQ